MRMDVNTEPLAGSAVATTAVDVPEPTRPEQVLRFTGTGAEYFRIWAVNLTLTVLTLGLFSAWAKLRRLQYFYRHTELDGAVFDYVANPVSILLGRLIALALLVLYYLAIEFSPWAGTSVTVLLACVLPYLLWQSNRFKARNTRYRGLAFGFAGTVREAYRVYLPPIVLSFAPSVVAMLVLGPNSEFAVMLVSGLGLLAFPFFHALFRRYVQSNLYFGTTRFEFSARAGNFAEVWAWGMGVMVIGTIAFFMVIQVVVGLGIVIAGQGQYALIFSAVAIGLSIWLAYLLIGGYFTTRFQRLVWEKTTVHGVGFRCDISATSLLWLQLKNAVAVICTLGLYRPFAAVRVAQYRLGSMVVTGTDALAGFAAGPEQSRRGATGDSAAEFFDLDVGL